MNDPPFEETNIKYKQNEQLFSLLPYYIHNMHIEMLVYNMHPSTMLFYTTLQSCKFVLGFISQSVNIRSLLKHMN